MPEIEQGRTRGVDDDVRRLWDGLEDVPAQTLADDVRGGSISEQAARFHALNPDVYRFAVRVARGVKASGARHYGIGAVWEVMRFRFLLTRGDVYKLNNNHRAWYAREIMAREADLAGFFSIRAGAHDGEYYDRPVSS